VSGDSAVSVALAIAWRPDEYEFQRFQRLYPQILEYYTGIAIASPPGVNPDYIRILDSLPDVIFTVSREPSDSWRHITVQQALGFNTDYIHYCDGDRAMLWLDTQPEDLQRTLAAIQQVDCLIIGRSESALKSYPDALKHTERIINAVFSYLLEQEVDLGAGSRGLSRKAAQYLIEHSTASALGTDSEWPILLHRAGFTVECRLADGTEYEIIGEEKRQRLESKEQWIKRVSWAYEIIQAGLESFRREL
jgi:hypothetical protein